jgi:hypothetical protein
VTKIGELGTTLAATSNRRTQRTYSIGIFRVPVCVDNVSAACGTRPVCPSDRMTGSPCPRADDEIRKDCFQNRL